MQADTVQTSDMDALRAENARLLAELVVATRTIGALNATMLRHWIDPCPAGLEIGLCALKSAHGIATQLEWRGRNLYLTAGNWESLVATIAPAAGMLLARIYGKLPAEAYAVGVADAHQRLTALLALDGLVVPPLPEDAP